MSTYKEEMEESANVWDAAEDRSGEKLAAGRYQNAAITTSRVQKSERTDEWQLFLVWQDMDTGGQVPMWYDIEQPIGASLAKSITKRLGWEQADEPKAVLALEDLCESGFFLDFSLDITVKDKPGETQTFKQVFINHVHGHAAPGGADKDDDIPFKWHDMYGVVLPVSELRRDWA